MPKMKKKSKSLRGKLGNPWISRLSVLALLLVMVVIPYGVSAMDQRVVATSDEVIVHSLSFNDADFLIANPSMFDAFGLNDTGDYNVLMMADNTTFGSAISWDNIDWVALGVSRVVLTVHDQTSGLGYYEFQTSDTSNGLSNQGTFNNLITNPFSENGSVILEVDYIDRLIFNQQLYLKFASGSSSVANIPNGSYVSFTVDFYGIEEAAPATNAVNEYLYGIMGVGMIFGGLFATPYVDVEDVKKLSKRTGKSLSQRRGAKRRRRK